MPDTHAPKGTIIALQLCIGYRKAMQPVERAEAIENLGLKGDRHALPDSSRQILLIEKETLDLLGLNPGDVKENITTVGIELMKLKHRDHIQIGSDVILEITKACSPCSRMDEIKPGLRLELAGRRGMLARVMRQGIIYKGNTIQLIEKQKNVLVSSL
jgi:MOSC domain-containing protein YiiM